VTMGKSFLWQNLYSSYASPAYSLASSKSRLPVLMRTVCPSMVKAACQRLLRTRRYTRTAPSNSRCVSSRSCRIMLSLLAQYGSNYGQVYYSVFLRLEFSLAVKRAVTCLSYRLLRDTKGGKRPFAAWVRKDTQFPSSGHSFLISFSDVSPTCCSAKFGMSRRRTSNQVLRSELSQSFQDSG